MKKLISSLILFLVFSTVISAASLYGEYKSNPIVKVTYNGDEVKPVNVPGINLKGTTMIPLNMLRQMGFNVSWDNVTKTVDVSSNEPVAPVEERSDGDRRILTQAEIQALDKAVAYIEVLDDDGIPFRQGSGFLINSSGLLITNAHVAMDDGRSHTMMVEVNGQTYKVPAGRYLFSDEVKDIYGVYLEGRNFPFLKANTVLPNKDDVVYAIGSPEGVKNVMSVGKVWFAGNSKEGRSYIGTTAEITGGSSGGALLNEYGEVVGITSNGGEYATTAVPIREVEVIYNQAFNR